MEWVELVSAYTELGILGLIAVMFLFMVFKGFSQNKEDKKNKTKIENKNAINLQEQQVIMLKNLQKQQQELIHSLQEQNNMFMLHQTEYVEKMINEVINGVNNHVPSKEETEKISKASLEIDKVLKHILVTLDANRVGLVQYHNGGRNLNKNSFLKMSMTNEQIKLGTKSIINEYKDQFRGMIARWIQTADEDGIVRLDDIDLVKDHDTVMYELFTDFGIQAAYGVRVCNDDGESIGFICVQYQNKPTVSYNKIHKELQNQQSTIQALLNIKIN